MIGSFEQAHGDHLDTESGIPDGYQDNLYDRMTEKQYECFKKRFNRFMENENIQILGTPEDDAFFSREPCECCKTPFAGDRHTVDAVLNDGTKLKFDICSDCVYYNTYDKLDDQTMESLTDE